jgi:metal-dependent amidase/aminoacylase/carboxypeptidase family protein
MWFSIELDRHSRKQVILTIPNLAEEDGSGAQKCFQTQNLLHLTQTMFLALHNPPDIHKSDYSKMILYCAVNSIIIKLEGITAHAGEPGGINLL